VEFSSVLDSTLKKSDVSLSGASSTISHGFFACGLVSSGMDYSYNAEDFIRKLSNSGEAVPPRSLKKETS
jgi:hypothetical protein